MEQKLAQSFYLGFWMHLLFCAILCVALVVLLIFRKKLFLDVQHNGKAVFWVVLCVLIVVLIFVSVKFVSFALDVPYVKTKQFQTFTGEVIGFTYVLEGNSPQDPVLGSPVFRDIHTGEEQRFVVGPCKIGETYTIIYLPHTRLAEIAPSN